MTLKAGVFVRWTVIFLTLWQSAFRISDAAMSALLKFLVTLLKAVVEKSTFAVLGTLSAAIPSSIFTLRKHVMTGHQNPFVEYVVCPSCYSIYKIEECITKLSNGEIEPKTCSYIRFPRHPTLRYRKVCGSLLKKIHLSNGKIDYKPRFACICISINKNLTTNNS